MTTNQRTDESSHRAVFAAAGGQPSLDDSDVLNDMGSLSFREDAELEVNYSSDSDGGISAGDWQGVTVYAGDSGEDGIPNASDFDGEQDPAHESISGAKRKTRRGGKREKLRRQRDAIKQRINEALDPHGIVERREASGKGYGLFAMCLIKASTCISSEQAIAIIRDSEIADCLLHRRVNNPNVPPFLRNALSAVSYTPPSNDRSQVEEIIRICKVQGMERSSLAGRKIAQASARTEDEMRRRWLYNTYDMQGCCPKKRKYDGESGRGLFPTGSRYNHDCTPNASGFVTYNPRADTLAKYLEPRHSVFQVHALKDISAGEEVTISYITGMDQQSAYLDRKDILLKKGFTCQCNTCLADKNGGRDAEDQVRSKLFKDCLAFRSHAGELLKTRMENPQDPRAVGFESYRIRAGMAIEIIRLMEQESLLGHGLARTYYYLAELKWIGVPKDLRDLMVRKGWQHTRNAYGKHHEYVCTYEEVVRQGGWTELRPKRKKTSPVKPPKPPPNLFQKLDEQQD